MVQNAVFMIADFTLLFYSLAKRTGVTANFVFFCLKIFFDLIICFCFYRVTITDKSNFDLFWLAHRTCAPFCLNVYIGFVVCFIRQQYHISISFVLCQCCCYTVAIIAVYYECSFPSLSSGLLSSFMTATKTALRSRI